jgi:hypothetical protein
MIANGGWDPLERCLSARLVILVPAKVPAVPRKEIEPCLYAAGLPAQDICPVLRSADWSAFDSPKQQLVFFCDSAKIECSTALPAVFIAEAFNIQDSHVSTIQSKTQKVETGGSPTEPFLRTRESRR